MRWVVALLSVLAIVVAALVALIFWPIRLRLSAHSGEMCASVAARVSLWPHLFSFQVYSHDIIPGTSQPHKTPTQRLASVKETIDRFQALVPVLSAALSGHHKLISVVWHSLVGTGDAALTAIACGSLWAAKSTLLSSAYARWGKRSDLPEYSVTPLFDRQCFLTDLDISLETSIASVILAPSFSSAVMGFVKAGRKRRE
ncbi:MAG TPA: DUF2953 domain-containing protein [Bacillota bacterium]|nr:DUF2953 domain-containing protein [Bacillota bacterium]HOB42215.1 DUF2953 domain-containing protein [Bacillota bacterium]HOO30182.1 DUF2953 domain-containing protein [Bacillota bacterium]HPQ02103.1 DUF2953 domain-containing protein [Bacillota bacterium]HPZ13140.1 DUF2953 domain-containing protein [Bacillota bacterium]